MMKGTIVCLVEVEIKIIVDASSHLEIAYEQIKVVEADVVKNLHGYFDVLLGQNQPYRLKWSIQKF